MTLLATDPVDLLLNPATGDLWLDASGSPQFSRGLTAVAQGIWIALRMFRGEWFLNLDAGFPWYQDILGHRYNQAQMLDDFRTAILAVPGVDHLASLTCQFDTATRTATVSWEAVAVFGGTVADSLVFSTSGATP